MNGTWLLIESSGRTARAGLARGGVVVHQFELNESRRLARDLAPGIGELLKLEEIGPKEVEGVMVSIGPGSYTGLRVGITAAKSFAYATGCRLIAVPTFAAIAAPFGNVLVVSDGLQGLVYRQRYSNGIAEDELRIDPAESLPTDAEIVGPWRKPDEAGFVAEPSLENLLRAGLTLRPVNRAGLFALEPLYLRGSSAEEKAKANEPRDKPAVR
jgi:tRNA threonylcarbamoyladenosine biosynthesis protein TsaB